MTMKNPSSVSFVAAAVSRLATHDLTIAATSRFTATSTFNSHQS